MVDRHGELDGVGRERMITAGAMLVALLLDAALGWPRALYASVGHPVTWMGALIRAADQHLNRDDISAPARRAAGLCAALGVIGISAGAGAVATWALPGGWAGAMLVGLLAWPLVAACSMYEHVAAVARPLAAGDLTAARQAVAMIVGRDPESLDEAGIARAATESLAENTSDGIVAPIFWGVLLGLPGILAYKAVNTLDSMIGHRTPRHEAFGWAAARIDDVANLIPARLTGLMYAAVSGRPVRALATMVRDARQHRSPNAGWPEAAVAGALGIRLSGPRVYGDRIAPEPWINGAAADPRPSDLKRALALYLRTMVILGGLLALLALV